MRIHQISELRLLYLLRRHVAATPSFLWCTDFGVHVDRGTTALLDMTHMYAVSISVNLRNGGVVVRLETFHLVDFLTLVKNQVLLVIIRLFEGAKPELTD